MSYAGVIVSHVCKTGVVLSHVCKTGVVLSHVLHGFYLITRALRVLYYHPVCYTGVVLTHMSCTGVFLSRVRCTGVFVVTRVMPYMYTARAWHRQCTRQVPYIGAQQSSTPLSIAVADSTLQPVAAHENSCDATVQDSTSQQCKT